MEDIKINIANSIAKVIEIDITEALKNIEIPKDSSMGDFAYPCFRLAGKYRKAPAEIASDIKEKIREIAGVEKIDVVSGYLNFYVNNYAVISKVISEILDKKDTYLSTMEGSGKTVCIDYSSPNIAKPFHIGHLRSTVIGAAIYKLYKALGYNVVGINYLGDFGTQFGYVIEGYNRWGNEYDLTENPIKKLVEIYVRINELAKEDEEVVVKARENFKKLEQGDLETLALWKKFKELSLEEYKRIYDKLGIEFDSYNGEAYYNDKMQEIIDILEDKDVLVESEGAKVVNLRKEKVPCMILKSNQSTTYATRDLAAILDRVRSFNFEKCLYITGYEQILHFKQVFEVSENIVDEKYVQGLTHIPFGMMLGPGGKKLSTRKGANATIDDILEEVIDKAKDILKLKGKVEEDIDSVARIIGVGAIIFNDLKNSRIKDVVFDLDEMLKFEGETGPYVQYTYARINSIISKAKYIPSNEKIDYRLLDKKEEVELVKLLAKANEVVKSAAYEYEPSILTRYIIDVASLFSKYYNEHQIIVDDEKLKKARLALVYSTSVVIKSGLNILGIDTPNKM